MAAMRGRRQGARGAVEDQAASIALLRGGADALLAGNLDRAKALLRAHIKASGGFAALAEATRIPPKSLIRMFGPRGNPRARNLGAVLRQLRRRAGLARAARPPAAAADRRLAEVIRRLQRHADRLREGGIAHLSLFGSLARGAARRGSDVDVLVEIDARKIGDLLDYAGAVGMVEDIVGTKVDVARRDRLRPHVAASALRDEIRVF